MPQTGEYVETNIQGQGGEDVWNFEKRVFKDGDECRGGRVLIRERAGT
jgi:hypothetical protein